MSQARRITRCRRRRGGWFILDALLAIGVIVVLAAALASSMVRQRRAEDRLAASRESVRLAEQALVALQSGGTAPTPPQGVAIEIRPSDQSAPHAASAAPAGWRWVTVRVTRDGRTSDLTGLVPAGGVP
jgi:type II secretory pathway pseudopilin PulG